MKFFFKVIIIFLIVFNWRIPYVYNTAFFSMILVTFLYIIEDRRIPFTYFFQRYNVVILIGTVFVALVIYVISIIHNTDVMNNTQKRMWVELVMLWAVIYALPYFVSNAKTNAFNEMSMVICCAFALQGMIHLTAFIYTPLGEYLFQMKGVGLMEKVTSSRYRVEKFRLYCLSGSVFVELVAAYGVAFILYFRLLLLNYAHPFFIGWKKYIILIFITVGTMLAGRTGFVGLGLGLFLWFIFSADRIFTFVKQNSFYIVSITIGMILVYNFLLPPDKRKMFSDEVMPFAFEWYYNYTDYGTLRVQSLDATMSQYYYLRDETLMIGHGKTSENGGGDYSRSDSGYMNNLIYGGIPYLLCLIIYQSLYFISPIASAGESKSYYNRVDVALFLLLFLFIFIVSYKTTSIGTLHTVMSLFIASGSSYITQCAARAEENFEEQIELT